MLRRLTVAAAAAAALLAAGGLPEAGGVPAGGGVVQPSHFEIEEPAAEAVPDQPTTAADEGPAARADRERLAELDPNAAGVNLDAPPPREGLPAPGSAPPPQVGGQAGAAGEGEAAGGGEGGGDEDRKKLALPAKMYDLDHTKPGVSCNECREWFARAGDPTTWTSLLPDCPCTLEHTRGSNEWRTMPSQDLSEFFPGAAECVLSKPVYQHGQQCCYTAQGRLITSGMGAGTPHIFAHPLVLPAVVSLHYMRDVLPFEQCCKQCKSPGCQTCRDTFYAKRPPNRGAGCELQASPLTMQFCEPSEHICFEHGGRKMVKAEGSCMTEGHVAGRGDGAGTSPGPAADADGAATSAAAPVCVANPTRPCNHECIGAEDAEVSFSCYCARELAEGETCAETVPLVRPLVGSVEF